MVKNTAPDLKKIIAAAIAEAERDTAAEIVLVVSPASESYRGYTTLYGLVLGSFIGMALWMSKTVTGFPLLFGIQVAAIALTMLLPPLRSLCLKLVPRHILHHHAARRAFEEYLFVSRHVPAERPIVLLYVSLAEKYVHVLHSRAVLQKIPNEAWDAVIEEFSTLMKNAGLQQACLAAIRSIAKTLQPQFPGNRLKNP
jgi:putative membrane protein